MYINCKTYFSFRYGTIGTEELVRISVENGTTALALTNINNTCDAWDFVDFCLKQAIKPILGCDIRNSDQLIYILIAANNKGFGWINEFISQHLLDNTPFPSIAAERPFFTDIGDGYVIYPPGSKSPEVLFSNERIGVLPSEVNKLFEIDLKKH